MHITLVLGTARKGRFSERVFVALQRMFSAVSDVQVEAVDVRDYMSNAQTVPPWEEGVSQEIQQWSAIASQTDAFVFILPEYNHGYPGEWKLLVDTLSKEYKDTSAYIVGVSAGMFGGARVIDHVKPVLVELNLRVHKTALYVSTADSSVSEAGAVTDEQLQERMKKFVQTVVS